MSAQKVFGKKRVSNMGLRAEQIFHLTAETQREDGEKVRK
jgi:hypothetical protein